MKLPHRLALAALLSVPLSLFLVARRASEKRPLVLATVPGCDKLLFSPDSQRLIVGAFHRKSYSYLFFDLQNSTLIVKRPFDAYYRFLLLSPDGKKMASADGYDWEDVPRKSPFGYSSPSFFVSDITSTKETRIYERTFHEEDEGDEPSVQSAVWTRDGHEWVVAGKRQIRRFDAHSGKLLSRSTFASLPRLRPGESYITLSGEESSAISPDGRQFIHIESPTLLTIRDTQTSRVQRQIIVPGNKDPYIRFGWSEHRHFVWVEAQGVMLFDANTSRLLWEWKGMQSLVGLGATDFHISSDEKSIVACNSTNCVARRMGDGHELWRTRFPNSSTFALSPDGKTLAEARANGQILLWPLPQTS